MMTVKRFDILSVAYIYAILSAAMGLIGGFFYAVFFTVFFTIAGSLASEVSGFGALGIGFIWIIAIIGFPIIYGIFGFIGGIIGAALYNVFSKWIGGIKVEFATAAETILQ